MIRIKAPVGKIRATLVLPGSKSISNRLLMLRAISGASLRFTNLSDSDDTILLAKALGRIQTSTSAEIDIHHAGTDMRFLTAYLAAKEGHWQLTGSDRMKERPVGELTEALKKIGADISFQGKEGFPPLAINGKKLQGGSLEIDGSISSQFTSALLLIAPSLGNGLTLKLKGTVVSRPYINMTVELLKQFGAVVNVSGDMIKVEPSRLKFSSSVCHVESDWSSASYWFSIAALSPQTDVTLGELHQNSLQADSMLPEIYKQFGISTEFKNEKVILRSAGNKAKHFSWDFTDCPDIAQTLAVTCIGLGVKAELRGLQTLKLKETNRIVAIKAELEKFGAAVEATDHTMVIMPPDKLNSSEITVQTYNDHRMAMSFAPLALKHPHLNIEHPEVVNKSYPEYWDDLQLAGFDLG
ncbi:MAG: 3-phosphoshikimate 1-carboxyvinyltransferase [Bacteroidia bacterium]